MVYPEEGVEPDVDDSSMRLLAVNAGSLTRTESTTGEEFSLAAIPPLVIIVRRYHGLHHCQVELTFCVLSFCEWHEWPCRASTGPA